MNKLTQWIKQHQVTAFFALTYALSWGLWLPWMLTRIELLELFGFIALFVPALACIAIARVVEPATAEDNRRARRMTPNRISSMAAPLPLTAGTCYIRWCPNPSCS